MLRIYIVLFYQDECLVTHDLKYNDTSTVFLLMLSCLLSLT